MIRIRFGGNEENDRLLWVGYSEWKAVSFGASQPTSYEFGECVCLNMAISARHDLPHWLFLKMPVLRFVGQWGTLLQIFSPAGGSSREVHGAIGTGFVVGAVLLRKFRFFRVVLSVSVLKNKQQRGGGQNLPGVNYIYLTARAQKKTQVKTTPPLNIKLYIGFKLLCWREGTKKEPKPVAKWQSKAEWWPFARFRGALIRRPSCITGFACI